MTSISRAITISLGAGIFAALLVPNASAGCGEMNFQSPFVYAQSNAAARPAASAPEAVTASSRGGSSASIVGLWKTQLISQGNTGHTPSIPDGVLIDFGYTQWHSDGTEILNSGAHSPASENFCLGVWGQTGFLSYELNHFPIGYDVTTGAIANYINLREQDTLSPSGDTYSGTFTLDVYDTQGNHVDHLVGLVKATRLTVDSTLPSSAPTVQ
jgi:hypothetical protein